jgi:uncharacterized protein (TIGR02147 family)
VSLISGDKAIRPRHFDLLKKVIPLDDMEETYFQTLIARKSARVFDRILTALSPGKNISTLFTNDDEIFSNWAILAIMFALEIPDLRSEKALAHAFREKLNLQEVNSALDLLVRKNLISERDGQFTPKQQIISSETDKNIAGVHDYYRQVLKLAQTAISDDVKCREFQFFSLTIAHDDLPVFKQMIREFRTKILSRSIHTLQPDTVYQAAIQFFPLTKVVASSSSKTVD